MYKCTHTCIPTLFSKYSDTGHLFSDDVQAYVHGPPSSQPLLASKIELLSNDLNSWMSSNRLSLNSAKTQLIWFGTPQQLLCSLTVFFTLPFKQLFVTWMSLWTLP